MQNDRLKRCFVISPIGAEGSDVREHADDVFDYIIKPAMEESGIEAFRSDHLHEPGKISEQMFRAILNDDLCVAVLTGHNPNVFYELAIAQCAARPVIILLEKGQDLPFDIRDLRCVYYDLKPRSLFDRVYVKQIVAHVRSLAAADWNVASPLGVFSPWGDANQDGQVKFFRRSMNYGSPEMWLEVLKNAKDVFELMGISLGVWKQGKGFSELLARKADEGCRVKVLMMHQDNPVLPGLINCAIPEESYESIIRKIDEMLHYFSAIGHGRPNVEVRQMQHGCPHFQLTRSDQYALAIQYMYSESTHYSPLCQYAQGSALYHTMMQEFDALWSVNSSGVI